MILSLLFTIEAYRVPLRHPTHCTNNNGKGEVLRFSVIHFQGFFIRWLGCYTILRGCRLPWPPRHCQNEKTPFMVSDERKFDTFPFN